MGPLAEVRKITFAVGRGTTNTSRTYGTERAPAPPLVGSSSRRGFSLYP